MTDLGEWQEGEDILEWFADEMIREQMRRDDEEDRERDRRDVRDRDVGESRKERKA